MNNQQKILDQMYAHKRYQDFIAQLHFKWDNLSLLAQLSGTGTDMTPTRNAFNKITHEVLETLAQEILNKTIASLSTKAQVIVDIVVRNLFERTADIGFLATDHDIQDYLSQARQGGISEAAQLTMKNRFNEYVKKYSVYSDIILLNPEGEVLVQLDTAHPAQTAETSLVKTVLTTQQAFVEYFQHSALQPHLNKSLVYAYKVMAPNSNTVLGILCLCFQLQNEMQGVFANITPIDDWAVGIMLDAHDEVIASSDPYQIPVGAKLAAKPDVNLAENWMITKFAGRDYIAVSRNTKGYQGYMGPNWKGHAMIPLERAFLEQDHVALQQIHPDLLKRVMRSPALFSPNMLDIRKQTSQIQSKLNQSIWNGNIQQNKAANAQENKFSKILLAEISKTGLKTQEVINDTVNHLYETVVSVMLENAGFSAFLALDIMDRNLYERANDCRWWALTTAFRKILSEEKLGSQAISQLGKTLGYINGLYTVYSNLFIFDRNGKVLAVSNPDYAQLVGTAINSANLSRIKTSKSSQDYFVSDFEPTPYYNNASSYIYYAAIRAFNSREVVGGIGITFDSAPQFSAMLTDALPKNADGSPVAGSFSLYVDGDLKVISSSENSILAGSRFDIHPALCQLDAGQSAFDVVTYNHQYYGVGASASVGYREYKDKQDTYQNKMTALVFFPLGKVSEIDARINAETSKNQNRTQLNDHQPTDAAATVDTEEFATFYIGDQWLGLPAKHIVEAVENQKISAIPEINPYINGIFKYRGNVTPVINLGKLLGFNDYKTPENAQMIVIQSQKTQQLVAMMVDALGEIPMIDCSKIAPVANIFSHAKNSIAVGVTTVQTKKQNSDPASVNEISKQLLTVLSAETLCARLH